MDVVLPPPPTKTTRRRRTKVPENLSEAEKEEWRKKNNKLAAQDLRNRKKQYEETLEKQKTELDRENQQLQERARQLEAEQQSLKNRLALMSEVLRQSQNPETNITPQMDIDDDENSVSFNANTESAALTPQQPDLQRMAPVLLLILGTMLSQPMPNFGTKTSSNQVNSSSPRISTPTKSTSKDVHSLSSNTPGDVSEETKSSRRSRRLAKRTSSVARSLSPTTNQRPSQTPPPPQVVITGAPEMNCTSLIPMSNPNMSATTTCGQQSRSRILETLQMHLENIAASSSHVKMEADDPLQSLLPLLVQGVA